MRLQLPQALADFLQLYFVKQGLLWYGCRCEPVWADNRWDVRNADPQVLVVSHEVPYIGTDADSLHRPA